MQARLGIDLRRGDPLVPEELLHLVQRHACVQQNGCDARTQAVRGDVLVNARLPGSVLDQPLDVSGSGEERHINVLPHPTGIFVAGHTDSANFPTTTVAFDTTQNGERDIFVSKITDLDFLPQPIGPVTTVSAASFLGPVAAESIASAFGEGLAPRTELAPGVPLPTVLADTSVQIVDSEGKESLGLLFFVADLQINFFIPAGVAPGPATVNVIVDGEVVATGDVDIQPVAPGLFFVGEQRIAAASLLRVNPDGSREPLEDVFTSNPIAPRTI